ncbi:hypothetical protein DRO35_04625, partial [Candidatus Bathyarchaeota archaeon]
LIVCTHDLAVTLTQRPHHLIEYLARMKKRVTFLHLRHLYEQPRDKGSPYIRKKVKIGGVEVRAIFAPFPSPLLNIFRGLCVLLHVLLFDKHRYRVGINQGDPWIGFVFYILRAIGVIERYVYEDLDYNPGGHKNWLFKRITEIAEYYSIKVSDLVICVSLNLLRLRNRWRINRVIYSPNGVHLSLFSRAIKKKAHPPTILYIGSITEYFGLDIAISVLPSLLKKIPEIRLIIAGSGYYLDDLKRIINKYPEIKGHIIFLGRIPHEKIPDLMAESDIGLAIFPPSELMHYACPIKIFEYMAAGLSIITTRGTEAARILKKYSVGLIINYSVENLKEAILKLFMDGCLYKRFSMNSLKFSVKHDWNKIFHDEFKEIESLYLEYVLIHKRTVS